MADIDSVHFMLGEIKATLESQGQDISEIKSKVESQESFKDKVYGGAVASSGIVASIVSFFAWILSKGN